MKQTSLVISICALSVLGVACNGNGEEPTQNQQEDAGVDEDAAGDVGDADDVEDVEEDVDDYDHPDERTADCDALMPEYCSMPWPSNLYLEEDDQRATGYTLDFGDTSLPQSDYDDEHVDPAPYRRLDGYGLGTPVAVLFPGVDTSGMPAEDSIADSIEDDDRDAFYFEVTDDGLEPVPFWAELDVHAEHEDEQVLYLRPAKILEEDTRYVVGFRNLVDESGAEFQRSEAFEKYLHGEAAGDEQLAWRQERFDDIFQLLEDAGIDRDELTLAWDFHTGSSEGLHGEMETVMDRGLAWADEHGVEMTVTSFDAHTEEDNPNIAYEVRGRFEVPHFLEPSDRQPVEAYFFHRDEDGKPAVNGTREADFWLQIPHGAVDGTPHGLVKYGHGMLGSGEQVGGSFNQRIAADDDLIFFGADFVGFSTSDVGQALAALRQPTYFEELVDRMHQGVLEYALLTRAMRDGLEQIDEQEPFEEEDIDIEIAVDEERIYYSGISQGGIYGVTYVAADPLVTRGHFGVGGQNYAMLLERSTNYAESDPSYFEFVEEGFPNRIDQSMVIPVIQLLWDKTDPISYLRKLSDDPFDPDVENYGLFAIAKGDYQVAVVTNEIIARSDIDIPIMENYDRERGEPWGVEVAEYPREGSGIVLYDFGNPWPPAGNAPPDDDYGDPHGDPRDLDLHNQQMVDFFDTGVIEDVCGGAPCYFGE